MGLQKQQTSISPPYKSVSYRQGTWMVEGRHKDLGGGILSFHREKWDALENADFINANGGEANVVPNTLLPTSTNKETPYGWLLVDDWRKFHSTGVARNAEEAIELLSVINFEGLMIDYDLGPGSQSGVAVLEQALEKNILPRCVEIVSTHPTGSLHLKKLLREAGYIYDEQARSQISVPYVGEDNHHTFKGFWRKLEKGESKPRRKITVVLNR